MNEPLYNRIGTTYNRTRQADPDLAASLAKHLNLRSSGIYLELGCGTGNYTAALAERGGTWIGLDPSSTMLAPAQDHGLLPLVQGVAEALPFEAETFDGITIMLAVHHFKEPAQALREVHRLLKPGGRVVIFTSCPEQMRGYWLNHYFPRMMARSGEKMPHRLKLLGFLQQAGFAKPVSMPWFMSRTHQDLFLYSGKDRPELYLQAPVRAGISSFSALAQGDELAAGLSRLKEDLENGEWLKVRREYPDALGDYLFMIAAK